MVQYPNKEALPNRSFVGLLLALLLTSGGNLFAQKISFTTGNPVGLRPKAAVWNFATGKPQAEVLQAVRRAGSALELAVEYDESTGFTSLLTKELTGADLDKRCHYPVFGLKTWEPMGTFAKDHQNRTRLRNQIVNRNRKNELAPLSRGVFLDLYPPSVLHSDYRLRSFCFQGEMHVTPNGQLGKRGLERVFAELGVKATVDLPDMYPREPAKSDLYHDMYLARDCTSALDVDPTSGELVCLADQHEE